MTSDDEFLRRLKSIVNTLELWGNLADAKAVEDAAARIREQRELLEECEKFFAEFAKAGGSGYAFRSRKILAMLRAAQPGAKPKQVE